MVPNKSKSKGFTLVEVLIASAVLALSVAAIAQAIISGQEMTYESLHHQRAVALASALLEEVGSLPYDDPEGETTLGPDTGESDRGLFDNIDDYHGFADGDVDGPVQDLAAVDYGDAYQVFSRSVGVVSESLTLTNLGTTPGQRVTVVVQDDRGMTWTLARFFADPDP